MTMARWLLLPAAAVLAALAGAPAQAAAGETLSQIKSRGTLRCGVNEGICAANGKRVTFMGFLRYGVPITICQLAVSALYVFVMFRLTT